MKLIAPALALVGLIVYGLQPPAYAHVLLREDSGELSAVLHINPDDDPIADRAADLFFDLESRQQLAAGTPVTITVQKPDGGLDSMHRQLDANGDIGLEYTFTSKGSYLLRLEIVGRDGSTLMLSHSQHVTRGKAADPSLHQHPLAEFILVVSISIFAILTILAIVHRREIGRKSVM